MKPHSLQTVVLGNTKTPAEIKAEQLAVGGWAARHGMHWPKGTVLPETQVLACPRVKVEDLPVGFLKQNHIERLEQDQKLASCCRHPENHFVEAFKSHPNEVAPDIYVFHCDKCKRRHRFLCVGLTDHRPVWSAS